MRNLYKLFTVSLGLGLLAAPTAHAQLGVGYPGATAPRTMLDVNGALSVAETALNVSSNAGTVPTTAGQVRLAGAPTGPVTLSGAAAPAPVAGQRVVIVNTTAFPATFNGQGIAAGQVAEYIYSNGAFLAASAGSAGNAWNLAGNAGTAPGAQFIGTTDAQDFVTKTSGTERVRVSSTGDVSFLNGGVAVDANFQGDGSLSHGLHFGYVASGEGITSNRTTPVNQYGLDFYTSNANRLAISGAGDVGIGTTGPGSKLQVNGAIGLPYLNSGGGPDPLVLDNSHHTIRRFGTNTIDLPAANTCFGRVYTLINGVGQGAFTLTVNGGPGTVYDDLTGTSLAAGPNGFPANTRITIQSDGSDWIVISR